MGYVPPDTPYPRHYLLIVLITFGVLAVACFAPVAFALWWC